MGDEVGCTHPGVMRLPLPEPTLAGRRCLLRPWEVGDAATLAAAWSDREVRRWLPVPDQADRAVAADWIAGEAVRRRAGLALDLVAVEPGRGVPEGPDADPVGRLGNGSDVAVEAAADVLGEVGLSAFDPEDGVAMIGWWTVDRHRRRGVATEMVSLLTTWALGPPIGLDVLVAEVEPANPGSVAVALAAGYGEVGRRDDGRLVMAAGAMTRSGRRV